MSTKTSPAAALRHREIEAGGCDIHVVEAGVSNGADYLLLHGWPEDWSIYESLLRLLGTNTRAVAMDLPGIGGSKSPPASGAKRWLAPCIIDVIRVLGLRDVTLVGHDVGGQIAYACLRAYPESVASVVLMNIVLPGIDPWEKVLRNPHLWHFAFHAIPALPEKLVAKNRADYFGYFYNQLAGPAGVTAAERERYVAAYARPAALRAGFEWYRAFAQDAEENRTDFGQVVRTPILYVRGDQEGGAMADYVDGLSRAGCINVEAAIIADCGHFAPSEQPELVAAELRSFAGALVAS